MATRKLPRDKETLDKIVEDVKAGKVDEYAKMYRYANRDSFLKSLRNITGFKLTDMPIKPQSVEEPPLVINLAPVKIKSYKPFKLRGKGDPETQVLLLGDHHVGEITPTYNKDVYKERMNQLYQSLLSITYLHRNMYPVNDLVIFMGGDMVHGENPRQGASVGSISCGAQEQVYDIALPELLSFILSLKQEFKTIKIYAVRGNHGRYSREAPSTSNWDMMLYKAIRPLLEHHKIEMEVSNNFQQQATIQGFKFFAFHGDQIKATQGIPYFALDRAVKSWYITFDGFDYALCFHFHKDDFFRVSAKTKAFINGPMPSDDPFSQEVIKTSTIPSQWTFGVHSRKGVSWAYSLITDERFLPQPVLKEG